MRKSSAIEFSCLVLPRERVVETLTKLEVYQVRYRGLNAASANMIVFWDVKICSLVTADQRFRGAFSFTEDRRRKFVRIIDRYPPDYRMQHLRIHTSSFCKSVAEFMHDS